MKYVAEQGIARMKAKYEGECKCGERVYPNAIIEYDIRLRMVVGCSLCEFTGQNVDPPEPPELQWDLL